MSLTPSDQAWVDRHLKMASEVEMRPRSQRRDQAVRRMFTAVVPPLLASWLLYPASPLLALVASLICGGAVVIFGLAAWRAR